MNPYYNEENLRKLLNEGFEELDLRFYCYDFPGFQPVYDEQVDSAELVGRIMETAKEPTALDTLLRWAKSQQPQLYERYQPYRPELPSYYTYRIRLVSDDRVRVEKRNPHHQNIGEPDGRLRYTELAPQLKPLLQAAQDKSLADSNGVKQLGETLFQVLFDPVLRQDFVTFYNQVVHQEKQLLRLELDIDEQTWPRLAALPWEFMRLPTEANLGTIWLGTAPKLIFARRRAQWLPPQPIHLRPNEKLRLAVVVAAPEDLGAVEYQKVVADLERLAAKQADRLELLPVVNPATPEAIEEILTRQPHLFHFIGHGRLNEESGQPVGQIALVDDLFNKAMWVEADYFSDLFNQYRPGVVLLQTCEGGKLSASQAFVGLASRVVQQNIPVVVAMQYELSNVTAIRFALRFYKLLAEDMPVDQAVQNGRRGIALGPQQYKTRDFATPVIFMRVPDGHLFQRAE